MHIQIRYDTESRDITIPDQNLKGILLPVVPEASNAEDQIVADALASPIGAPPLREVVRPGERVVIVTSDITRPMPTAAVLPHVVAALNRAGIPDADISVVFGLGIHRPHTPQEQQQLVGAEMYARIACEDSTPDDVAHLGDTSRGTPIDLSRRVVDADRRICLGNIEYHYFAGFSGGMKAIMPGVSTREAIQANHSRMVEPAAMTGRLDGNPVREDIEEVARKVTVDYIVNVVLDERKRILKAFAGDVVAAHRAGCRYLDSLYSVELDRPADIVVVSAGGFPKDLNLYQAQKALDNAQHAVREGGVIILTAACREGLGEAVFEEWLVNAPTSRSLIDRIRQDFQLGGHKAAAMAMVMEKAAVYLVSELPPEFVEQLFMTPFPDTQAALGQAFRMQGREAGVLVMPYGGSTLPIVTA